MVSSCGKNSSNMNRSESQKTVLKVLRGQGIVFGFYLEVLFIVHQSNTQRWLSSTGGKNANYKMGEVHNVKKE